MFHLSVQFTFAKDNHTVRHILVIYGIAHSGQVHQMHVKWKTQNSLNFENVRFTVRLVGIVWSFVDAVLKLSDCNWAWTQNHLVHKQTLSHLAKLAKRLNCFECLSVRCIWLYILIMSHTRFRVNPHSIVAWMSRSSLLEAGQNLKFKWLQLDSNPEPLSS